MKVKSIIKRRSEYSQGTLREIFDDEVNKSEVGGCISFAQIQSAMYKRKRLFTPPVHLHAQNAIHLMAAANEEYNLNFAFAIEGSFPDEVAVDSCVLNGKLHSSKRSNRITGRYYVLCCS